MENLVIKINGKLEENDILVYRKGSFFPIRIRALLPELEELQKQINELKAEKERLEVIINEHEKLIDKNAHDIRVDRGLEDE